MHVQTWQNGTEKPDLLSQTYLLRLCSQIMLLDRFTDRHSQPLLEFRSIALFTVEGTKPAEIVGQVARGHTAKLSYLGFEPVLR